MRPEEFLDSLFATPPSSVDEPSSVVLSDEQKLRILELWEAGGDRPPSMKELTQQIWGDGVDSRSVKGRAIKEFLISKQLKPSTTVYVKKDEIALTEPQKEYITNNCANMRSLEIAKVLFNNESLCNLSKETLVVSNFIQTLDNRVVYDDITGYNPEDYRPPRTLAQALARINKYVHEKLELNKITPEQKRTVNTLIGYLHTFRFKAQINTYSQQIDKELFESEFIRCTYDKADLTEEEVDQYIVYASEVVMGRTIVNRITNLEAQQDTSLEDTGRLNIGIVDAVKSLRNEYNQCIRRQNDLLDALKGERKERINKRLKDNAGILNLINLWKEEESRKQLIELAMKEKGAIKDEIHRLKNLDEVKAKILGLTEEEALLG